MNEQTRKTRPTTKNSVPLHKVQIPDEYNYKKLQQQMIYLQERLVMQIYLLNLLPKANQTKSKWFFFYARVIIKVYLCLKTFFAKFIII